MLWGARLSLAFPQLERKAVIYSITMLLAPPHARWAFASGCSPDSTAPVISARGFTNYFTQEPAPGTLPRWSWCRLADSTGRLTG